MNSKPISDEHIQTVNRLLHKFLYKLGVNQLVGIWSETLEGFTPLDLYVLKLVADKPDIIIKEVKDDLKVPGSTLTSVINRLEKRGCLQRLISSRDRRSYGLELTSIGKGIHHEHMRVDRLVACNILETLDSDTERQTFIELLTTITQRLK